MTANQSKVYLGMEIEHFKKEGMSKIPEEWEDGNRTPYDRHHFEWWYFDAELDDGSVLVVIFGPKPFFDTHFPKFPLVVIDYTDPSGKQIQEAYLEKKWKKNYSNSKENCEVRIGNNYFIGDLKDYKIKARTKSIEVDIELHSLSKPWRPGNGYLYFKKRVDSMEKYFAWLSAVPYGKVRGTISINGVEKQVNGTGYHDHNWGNADPSSLFHHWYWSRSHFGNYLLVACNLMTRKEYGYEEYPYILLMDENGVLAEDGTRVKVLKQQPVIHPKTKKLIYDSLNFLYNDNKIKFSLNLQRKNDIVLGNLLRLNSPHLFLRQLGKSPWYHRFQGISKFELEKEAHIEQFESTVIYELMYYGKTLKINMI